MNGTRVFSLVPRVVWLSILVALATAIHVTPVVAQPKVVTCGAVLDTPGMYELAADLTCHLGVPPPQFCDAAAVTITASGVRLNGRGFTLSGGAGPDATGVGIRITASNARVENIAVEAFAVGIAIEGGGRHRLSRVAARRNNDFHCGSGGVGLAMSDTSMNVVQMSDLSQNTRWGLRMQSSSRNLVTRSQLRDNRFQPGDESGNVDLSSSHGNLLTVSNLSNGGLFGVRMTDSNRNMIADNVVDDTAAGVGFGIAILLSASSHNDLRRNTVDRAPSFGTHYTGIAVGDGAVRNRVLANTVLHHTAHGIVLATGATANTIQGNRAQDNAPFDAADTNPGCDANRWLRNQFGTVNPAECIH
jgi:nitrous oxidase accessory protein NosD